MLSKRLLTFTLFLIAVSLASSSLAQDERPYAFFGQGGYTKVFLAGSETPSGSFGLGGGASYTVTPEVTAGIEASYFYFGSREEDESVESKWSAIPATLQLAYYVPVQSSVMPYAGGGAGLYNLRLKLEGDGVEEQTDSANKFGVNFGGGVKIKSEGAVSYGVDVRYHIAFQDEEDNWKMLSIFGRIYF